MPGLEELLKANVEQMQVSEAGRPKGPLPINFGLILFPGFQALDAFGPMDALNTLSVMFPLKLSILSSTLDPVSTKLPGGPPPHGSDFGQSINPTHTFDNAPPLDVLIIPGGLGTLLPDIKTAVDFVARVYPQLKYLFTVCTGASVAARAGVLDGKKATTNKALWKTETAQRPQVKWVPHARWVEDGNVFTSSGISAGLDGIFAFIAAVYGEEAAEKVAVTLEYDRHRDPSWDPFAKIYNLPENS